MDVFGEKMDYPPKPKQWLGVRHVQALMMFLGLMLSFCTRANLSLAIVAMTDPNNEIFFSWSIQRQSVILSAFGWGEIGIMVFSAVLASRFGGMRILTISLGVNSILSLLLPLSAVYGGWMIVCACRVLQGVTQGVIFPVMHYLIAKWIPVEERGRLTCFIFSGGQFGIAFQLIVSGFLADYWGWPAIFYADGLVGLVWIGAYLILGSDNPQDSKRISADERLYIQSSLEQIGGHKRLKTPWRSILTSVPFFATVAANIGFNWGFWTLLTEIPTYMSNILNVDIRSNGIISALPYITLFVMSFPVGFISDFMIKKELVSVTTARKIFNSFGFFGPAIVLLCFSFVPAGNIVVAVLVLCGTLGLCAGYCNGYMVIFLDMAPNFSSQMMAFSNCAASVVALFAPLAVGFILKDESNPNEWQIVFYVSATIFIVTNTIFVIFASGKKQEWNDGTQSTKSINI